MNALFKAKKIAQALPKWIEKDDKYMACCPVCEHGFPSLNIMDCEDGNVLVSCANGCSQEIIINKLCELSIWSAEQFTSRVSLICASSIHPEPINWIWKGYLAAGKLHILAGIPSTGKTTISLNFAARISTGEAWPDNSEGITGNVLIWSGEDDPTDTLTPRLIAQGANRDNVYFVSDVLDASRKSKPFDPSIHMPALHNAAEKIGNVKLIIIDPVVNAVLGDSHKNGEVRRSLQPLVDLGTRLNASILGITHFSKGTGGRDPLERVTGSLAFGALARIVLVAVKDEQCTAKPRYLLSRAKSNIGQDGGGLYYSIEETELLSHPNITTSIIKWHEKAIGNSKELLSDNSATEEKVSAQQEAKDFLISLLSDGEMPAKDVYRLGNDIGLSRSTIDRAKRLLDIKSIKTGYKEGSVWKWVLI